MQQLEHWYDNIGVNGIIRTLQIKGNIPEGKQELILFRS